MDLRDIPGMQDYMDADQQLINYGIALSANGCDESKRSSIIPAYLIVKHRERYRKSELIQMPQSDKKYHMLVKILKEGIHSDQLSSPFLEYVNASLAPGEAPEAFVLRKSKAIKRT
ncbi:hypothetical protein RF11_16470 [Thelohanellus kitauei]|uniref:Uncharacterized protein n=1 Tax=Thelohanellus kitauei TaxID=669202 RepID=A0A0C2JH98_THEKT|nr:hypothetical protein RF11_16470 [Thelohanellus kitauei]